MSRIDPRLALPSLLCLTVACANDSHAPAKAAVGPTDDSPTASTTGPRQSPRDTQAQLAPGDHPGGQTGEEGAAPDEPSQPPCPREPLGPGEDAPLDLSIPELQALVDRAYTTVADWPAPPSVSAPPWLVSITAPEGPDANMLTLAFRPEGSVYRLKSHPETTYDEPEYDPCRGVVIEATVDLVSGAGPIAGPIATEVTFDNPHVGYYELEVPAEELVGALTFSLQADEGAPAGEVRLTMRGYLSAAGVWGEGWARVFPSEADRPDSGPEAAAPPAQASEQIDVLRFPADNDCEEGYQLALDLEADFRGVSGAAMVATLDAIPQVQVDWDDGSKRTVGIQFATDDRVCVDQNGVWDVALLTGQVTLSGEGASHADSARLFYDAHTRTLGLSLPDAGYNQESLRTVLGVPKVDFGELMDPYLRFDLEYALDDDPATVSGTGEVGGSYWMVYTDCELMPAPPGGDGDVDCGAGLEWETLATASVTAAQ